MKEEYQGKFIELTNEISDALLAMSTYLNRNKILVDKLTAHNLPPNYLEEWGEFLEDWGRMLVRFGSLSKERDLLLMKIFEIEKDDN